MGPALATTLVLVSAVLHAGWNTALRSQPDARAAAAWVALGSAILSAALAVLFPGAAPLALSLGWGVAAGVSEGCYFASLGRAVEIGPLGAVYAVSRGAPLLLLWPSSHLLLGEPVSAGALLAVGLLLGGLLVLSPLRLPGAAATSRAGFAWALATALFNATNALLYKAALSRGAGPLPLFAAAVCTAAPISLVALGGSEPIRARLGRALGAAPWSIALGAAACTGAFLLVLLVLRERGAAWVMTLRNTSIAFAPLSAWLLLGERPGRRAGLGIALVFAAAALLGL